jgi:hypothetical protein
MSFFGARVIVLLAAGGVDGLLVEEKGGASHVQPVTTAIAIECCGDKSMPFGPPTFPGGQKVGGPFCSPSEQRRYYAESVKS